MGALKYFVFNKKRDYRCGYMEHISLTDRGIRWDGGKSQQGTFFTRLLDSGREGNQWHRAVVKSAGYGDDSIRFFFYCSDSPQVYWQGEQMEWLEVIKSASLDAAQKRKIMKPFLAHSVLNPQDILLYHARGRYLWMEIQLFPQGASIPEIHHMKIYAENKSFIKYLPEIYQNQPENDFLKRYLSIFEGVYQKLDEEIRDAPCQLDPQTAELEFLRWMAKWVGISQVHLWPEEKLRKLLQGIVRKNLVRGTRAYMENIIETFTGERPVFVEYGEIEQYKGQPESYQKLLRQYVRHPYIVNLLIREEAVPTRREQRALKEMIEDIKPAHLEIHLIFLKPCIYLDKNVYLGINSVLNSYQRAQLNGQSLIPSIVGKAKAEEERRKEEAAQAEII